MSLSPFEFRNAPEFFYSAANQSHNLEWSTKATLYGRLVLAASGSEMQTATPVQCGLCSFQERWLDMNPLSRIFRVRKCELCDVKFSHFHHYFPKTRGGQKTGSKSGAYLCPNHHHMANILQLQIGTLARKESCGAEELQSSDFPELDILFDDAFRAHIRYFLVGYEIGEREYLTKLGLHNESDYE